MIIDDKRPDADLARAHVAGDRHALAAIYDRHAPGLYDTAAAMLRDRDAAGDVVQDVFCTAAVKLGQLRDPERLKPWLYAIARHEIYRRSAKRKRSVSLETVIAESGREPVAPEQHAAEGRGQIGSELAAVVRAAAAGLDAEDQLVLELSARQGLSGADLAAALGVDSAPAANKLVFRMRQRLERAVGAYVVTRGSRRRCDELASVLRGWDGTFDVLWRKRIARHVDGCETCQETRRGAAVLSLAGSATALLLPAGLRPRVLQAAEQALAAASGGSANATSSADAGSTPGSGTGEVVAGAGGPADGPAGHTTAMVTSSGRATITHWRSDGFPGGSSRRGWLLAMRLGAVAAFVAVALLASLQLRGDRDQGRDDPAVDPVIESTVDPATTLDVTPVAATTDPTTDPPTTPPPTTRPPITRPPATQPPTTVVVTVAPPNPPLVNVTDPPRQTRPPTTTTTTAPAGRGEPPPGQQPPGPTTLPGSVTFPLDLVVVPGNSFFFQIFVTTTAPVLR